MSSNHTSHRYIMQHLNGFIALAVIICAAIFIVVIAGFGSPILLGILGAPLLYCLTRFSIIQPNTALVATLFGRYAGILPYAGFYWILPFYKTTTVSLRTANYVTDTLKVNDASGTPIEIAAAIVYHIENPAAAVLDVENAHSFLQVQSESALRALATHHPYTASQGEESLTGHSERILEQFRQMVQERVEAAGISIDEARFTHLAYAPEIAQAMLRKQQAEAVILARQTLVRGAIGMVEGTVKELARRQIVNLSDAEKAKLVTNMMTVLLSEENAAPMLNVSGE